jgi:hypothetical protein
MVGQGPTRRLAPLERLHLHPARGVVLMPGLGLGLIFFQIEQAPLERPQQRTAFRRGAEPAVPQLCNRLLELLDVQCLVVQRNPVRLALS